MMTCCHFGIKRGHGFMNIGRVANLRIGNSIMAFIFQIDEILINYPFNDNLFSFWYQTRSIMTFSFQNDQIFINNY